MKFIDEAKIFVKSGHGGPGAISWRREKFIPRGGPDGGDGGKGGDVIFESNPNLGTLLDFKFNRRYIAEDGKKGDRQNMTGADGQNIVIPVPVGTIIKNINTGEKIVDLDEPNKRFIFLKGGRGGKGNSFFKNSVNQAPKFAQPGEPGEEMEIALELKLLADVGIIGFPNAGKSTLISRISAARPKIADYPFTTLVPNLGVVQGQDRSFVVADIPGLVKDAHKGTGLGIRFLKHVERTKFFIHLIDGTGFTGRDPLDDFKDLNEELRLYDESKSEEEGFFNLSSRRQIIVINKADAMSEDSVESLKRGFKKLGFQVNVISAATGLGITDLVKHMTRILNEKESH